MNKTLYVFRCYAKRDGDQYVALCVDLCLAAQADTLPEAHQKLHEQIKDYVQEAFAEPAARRNELLSRKAPMAYRAEYWLANLATSLRHATSKRLPPAAENSAWNEPVTCC